MIRVKKGVRLSEPVAMALLLHVAEEVFAAYGATVTTITSGVDGKHSVGSLHYAGRALDFRVWDVRATPGRDEAENIREVAIRMQEALGEEFDVVNEGDHIHAEWDPKPAGDA